MNSIKSGGGVWNSVSILLTGRNLLLGETGLKDKALPSGSQQLPLRPAHLRAEPVSMTRHTEAMGPEFIRIPGDGGPKGT